MTQETALGATLRSAVQTMSKKKQTGMIADHIHNRYDVLKHFKPLAVGIDQDLVAVLPQFDPSLIACVLASHYHHPRYLKSLTRGGKHSDLDNRFKGEISLEEQAVAQQHSVVQQGLATRAAHRAAIQEEQLKTVSTVGVSPAESETSIVWPS